MSKQIAVIMGSNSDYPTMKHACATLDSLGIQYKTRIISAHRTPDRMYAFSREASSTFAAVIAGAGGAAHLPGMVAAMTSVPILGVPIDTGVLRGQDSLLSIVQMPKGVPVATFAIGKSGAVNAAIFAARIIALNDTQIKHNVLKFIESQTEQVELHPSDI